MLFTFIYGMLIAAVGVLLCFATFSYWKDSRKKYLEAEAIKFEEMLAEWDREDEAEVQILLNERRLLHEQNMRKLWIEVASGALKVDHNMEAIERRTNIKGQPIIDIHSLSQSTFSSDSHSTISHNFNSIDPDQTVSKEEDNFIINTKYDAFGPKERYNGLFLEERNEYGNWELKQ